jgi:SprT-like family protein
MSLPLSPDMLAAAYDYLASTNPFDKWNFPISEEIKFRVYKRSDRYAHYQCKDGKLFISVSSVLVGSHITLLSTMAHEMIHLYMHATSCLDMRCPHGAGFNKLADRVCRIHGFDRLIF